MGRNIIIGSLEGLLMCQYIVVESWNWFQVGIWVILGSWYWYPSDQYYYWSFESDVLHCRGASRSTYGSGKGNFVASGASYGVGMCCQGSVCHLMVLWLVADGPAGYHRVCVWVADGPVYHRRATECVAGGQVVHPKRPGTGSRVASGSF